MTIHILRNGKAILIPLCLICLTASIMMLMHSLQGYQLVGCGAGSGCDNVMGSLWAYFAGKLPVSCVAVMMYSAMFVCLLCLNSGTSKEDQTLNKLIWSLLVMMSGAIVGVAIWFSYIQAGILHTFCKYCTLTHLIGTLIAVILVLKSPDSPRKKTGLAASGLAAAAVFVLVQVLTMPAIVYDEGYVEEDLPAFEKGELPSVGPTGAEHEITLLFDFQCVHCRALHDVLAEAADLSEGEIRFQLCPISLSGACNPFVARGGIDRFEGSCEMARYALAVWLNSPEQYPEVETFLLGSGDIHATISPQEAYDHISTLLGSAKFDEYLLDKRIDLILSRAHELYGRTSSSEKSGIPRMIHGQNWLVPETSSAEELVSVIRSSLL